jgi:hypothetical protein
MEDLRSLSPLIQSEPETAVAQNSTAPRPVTPQSLDMPLVVLRVLPHTSYFTAQTEHGRPFPAVVRSRNLLECVDPDPDDPPTPETENLFF